MTACSTSIDCRVSECKSCIQRVKESDLSLGIVEMRTKGHLTRTLEKSYKAVHREFSHNYRLQIDVFQTLPPNDSWPRREMIPDRPISSRMD